MINYKKKIVSLIILLNFALLGNLFCANSKFARLHYDGGGDWYNDPDILPNLTIFLKDKTNADISIEQAIVRADDNNLFDYPFIFLTGHGNIKFSDKEIINLRKYFDRGGFLYADDDFGMDKAFRREIKKIFPNKNLVELPPNHEIFHSYFQFSKGLPKIHKHEEKRPQAFAIFDDTGKLLVLYTFESNISDGWASPNVHNDPPEIREQALKMGVNIFYYLMTE